MKAAQFEYLRPTDVEQVIAHLASDDRAVKLMGGSQSLGPMLNLRLARPQSVVDVCGIETLRGITETDDRIRIGACVTHAQIEDGVFPALRGHMMQEVAGRIAYRGVRNRGTLAGSLAHADPAADWVVATSALGAQVHIAGGQQTRDVAMPDFMHAAYTTDLTPQELILAVSVPKHTPQTRWGYYKFCRKTGEFAEASCAAWFDASTHTAQVAVGALDGAPVLLNAWALDVAGNGWAAVTTASVHEQVERFAPQASRARKQLLATVIERCLAQVLGERPAGATHA